MDSIYDGMGTFMFGLVPPILALPLITLLAPVFPIGMVITKESCLSNILFAKFQPFFSPLNSYALPLSSKRSTKRPRVTRDAPISSIGGGRLCILIISKVIPVVTCPMNIRRVKYKAGTLGTVAFTKTITRIPTKPPIYMYQFVANGEIPNWG